jgi:hypothetical protein
MTRDTEGPVRDLPAVTRESIRAKPIACSPYSMASKQIARWAASVGEELPSGLVLVESQV